MAFPLDYGVIKANSVEDALRDAPQGRGCEQLPVRFCQSPRRLISPSHCWPEEYQGTSPVASDQTQKTWECRALFQAPSP